MSQKNKSPYGCTFCRERLVQQDLQGLDYVRLLLFLRPYQCPHCFQSFDRPFAWLTKLPLIGRIAKGGLFARNRSKEGVLPQRDGDPSSVSRRIAAFGRWVERCEKWIFRQLKRMFRAVWGVIWFLPGLFLGKRADGSRRKFVKSSNRSRSRSASRREQT